MKISYISKSVFILASAFGLATAITDIETAVHTGYDLMTIRPPTFEPPVGGMEFLPDGKLLVLTWRGSLGPEKPFMDPYTKYGDLYEVSGVQGTDRNAITVKKIADGFKDALGVLYVDGSIYVGDIDRLIKLVDNNGDGYFETKETFAKIPAYNAWFEFALVRFSKMGSFTCPFAVRCCRAECPKAPRGLGDPRFSASTCKGKSNISPAVSELRTSSPTDPREKCS